MFDLIGGEKMVNYNSIKVTYHRYICSISFLNIMLQVDARNQGEACEIAALSIINYFEHHLDSKKYINLGLTKLLTNKNVIKSILEITYEKSNESGVYSSSFENWK